MSWIKIIKPEEAGGKLKKIYDKIKGPGGHVDNVLLIHSLRPHTLMGHMTLYKSVLHHHENKLPKWYLEALGVYVSHLNSCNYCFEHHYAGFSRLLDDEVKSQGFKESVKKDTAHVFFGGKYNLGFVYAKDLTHDPGSIRQGTIENLRAHGFTDGEILEVNQVCAYFNYVNRMVVGLGVSLEEDNIGLSPNDSDDPANWAHQ